MKKNLITGLILFMVLSISGIDTFAQLKSIKEMRKEREAKRKIIEEKAVKKARKEAEELKKAGWTEFEGDRPMDKMLEDSWMKMEEKRTNNDMSESNAYIWASNNGVAKSKSAAKMQATELAKVDLASQLETQVNALTTSNMGNIQLTTTDAETNQEVIQSAKTLTSATLTNIKPVVVLYRTAIPAKELKKKNLQQLAPGTVEVQVILFYDLYQVDIQVRQSIKKTLKEKMNKNEEELNNILGIDEK